MLIRKLFALAAVALGPAVVSAEEIENPYKRAEKGQWVNYKLAAKFFGQDVAGTVKQSVLEKTDKSVKIEVVSMVAGMEQKQTQDIDLTKPFNPLAAANLPAAAGLKTEKKGSGKETIEAGGKKVETEWTTYKMDGEQMGQKFSGEMKVWLAKDLPVGGLAKMNMKMEIAGMEVEFSLDLDKHGKD